MKVLGGHAVMLRVMMDSMCQIVRDRWVAQQPSQRSVKDPEAHVTLAFVGRDLDEDVVPHVTQAGIEAFRVCPPGVRLDGRLSKFGRDRDHLVAHVTASPALLEAREAAISYLRGVGVKIRTDFDFNPHVTLAVGPGFEPAAGALPPRVLRVYSVVSKVGSERRRELRLANTFPCGCSWEKIEAGLCDQRDQNGNERLHQVWSDA